VALFTVAEVADRESEHAAIPAELWAGVLATLASHRHMTQEDVQPRPGSRG
jgi:hypothetical protein